MRSPLPPRCPNLSKLHLSKLRLRIPQTPIPNPIPNPAIPTPTHPRPAAHLVRTGVKRRRARQLGDERRLGNARDQRFEDGQAGADDGRAGVDGGPELGAGVGGLARAGHVAEDDFDDAGYDDARLCSVQILMRNDILGLEIITRPLKKT